ncbi:hypothetical protein CRENPOLYSF1_1370001 [Crenothrix polyspora]|uniref:Uncharacterized protein n=1 Tax=Crenothrix polyspora TaxID=360316 RepID=A0A1R4H1P8_9GAMM|nr:hypothetical protein CRENPOLYSF1_1370001 [Crenothrix polyspora]
MMRWHKGFVPVCKTGDAGSNPARVSKQGKNQSWAGEQFLANAGVTTWLITR